MSPRDSGRLISETAKDVTIDQEGVSKVAQLVRICKITLLLLDPMPLYEFNL